MGRIANEIGMLGLAAAALLAAAACDPEPSGFQCTEKEGADLYERRIAPLLADDHPSSCNECHLQGVDLALFIQTTPCATMACMVERDLVDLEQPERSLVLAWIDRATPSGGITQASIDAEREGMLEWIQRSSFCGDADCPEIENPCGDPADSPTCEIPAPSEGPRAVDDPGDCSDRTLELLWKEKVFAWRGRCFPCHFQSHDDEFEAVGEVAEPPPWIVDEGACDSISLATLRNAEERGFFDPSDPLQSKLLTKPLEEELGGVEHGGGPKMHSTDEAAYIDFVAFLTRWADCK